MVRNFDREPGVSAAVIALESGTGAAMPIRQTAMTGRQGRPVEALYRVRSGHLFMANTFKDGPGKAFRGEIQKVLLTLRWDPIDGRLFALASGEQRDSATAASDGAAADGRFGLGPEVANWLRERALGQDLQDLSNPGLSLLELCSCIAVDPSSGEGARAALRTLEDGRARGELAVYAGSARFFWRKTYHLALLAAISVGGGSDPVGGWHPEGGQYEAAGLMFDGPVWRRRPRQPAFAEAFTPGAGSRQANAENMRPADSFDPRPAYLFDGLEAETAGLLDLEIPVPGAGQAIRFQPFLLRVGGLAPWPPNPLLRDAAGAGRPGRLGHPELSGLAAWYRPCPGNLTMRWLVSPRLDQEGPAQAAELV